MQNHTRFHPYRARTVVLATVLGVVPVSLAAAPHLTTLYTFTGGADGGSPEPSVISGPDGALFGVTTGIGAGQSGSIYELLPPAVGSTTWRFKNLYTFTGGVDGSTPGNLVLDKQGNLFGEASTGGNTDCSPGCGTVFELRPPAYGQTAWTETTLYTFSGGADGRYPDYGLAMDRSGRLYGFAGGAGLCASCGTAFVLTPPHGDQAIWSEFTLYQFPGGTGGNVPTGVPLLASDGSVFGVTAYGGNVTAALCTTNLPVPGCGTAFRLIPPHKAKDPWTLDVLRRFDGKDAGEPSSALVADRHGDLFGTALQGGDLTACADPGYPPGCGTVFELTPPTDGSNVWGHRLAWSFTAGPGGDYPYTDALVPIDGNFITTVEGDGIATYGTIVEFTPPAYGFTKWSAKTLYTFSGADGAYPAAALLRRGQDFIGTTVEGGNTNCYGNGGCGTVFKLSP